MSKQVEREAERLAAFLQNKPTRGDRVIVMVVRSHPDGVTTDIGCSTVLGSKPAPALPPKLYDIETLVAEGAIAIVRPPTKRRAPKRRKGPKRKS